MNNQVNNFVDNELRFDINSIISNDHIRYIQCRNTHLNF